MPDRIQVFSEDGKISSRFDDIHGKKDLFGFYSSMLSIREKTDDNWSVRIEPADKTKFKDIASVFETLFFRLEPALAYDRKSFQSAEFRQENQQPVFLFRKIYLDRAM
jgi:hypothetical protein